MGSNPRKYDFSVKGATMTCSESKVTDANQDNHEKWISYKTIKKKGKQKTDRLMY